MKRNAHMERIVAEAMAWKEPVTQFSPCLTEEEEWDAEHPEWRRTKRKVDYDQENPHVR